MIKTSRRFAVVLAASLAAGCSGGGGSPTPSQPATSPHPPAGASRTLTLKLKIPAKPVTTASTRRLPKFVSPDTASVTVTTYQPGAYPAGPAYDAVTTNVSPSTTGAPNANCTNDDGTTGATNGSRTCTVAVDAPATTSPAVDTFVFSTYASTNGTGTPLATALVTKAISLDQSNTISAELGGIPHALSLVPVVTSVDASRVATYTVGISAFDAAGDLIIANGQTIADASQTTTDDESNYKIGVTCAVPGGQTPPNFYLTGTNASAGSCATPLTVTNSAQTFTVSYGATDATLKQATFTATAMTTSTDTTATGTGSAYLDPIYTTGTTTNAAFFPQNDTSGADGASNDINGYPTVQFGGSSSSVTLTLTEMTAANNPAASFTAPAVANLPAACAGIVGTITQTGSTTFTVTPPSSPAAQTAGTCLVPFTDNYGGTASVAFGFTKTSSTLNVGTYGVFASLTDTADDTNATTFQSYDSQHPVAGAYPAIFPAPPALANGLGIVNEPNGNFYVDQNQGTASTIVHYLVTGSGATYSVAKDPTTFTPAVPLQSAGGLAFDSQGYIYIADVTAGAVYHFDSHGTGIGTVTVANPLSIAVDKADNQYITTGQDNLVREYSSTTNDFQTGSASVPSHTIAFPAGVKTLVVAVDANGDLFLTSLGTGTMNQIYASVPGQPIAGFFGPTGGIALGNQASQSDNSTASPCNQWGGLTAHSVNDGGANQYDLILASCLDTGDAAGIYAYKLSGAAGVVPMGHVTTAPTTFLSISP